MCRLVGLGGAEMNREALASDAGEANGSESVILRTYPCHIGNKE